MREAIITLLGFVGIVITCLLTVIIFNYFEKKRLETEKLIREEEERMSKKEYFIIVLNERNEILFSKKISKGLFEILEKGE